MVVRCADYGGGATISAGTSVSAAVSVALTGSYESGYTAFVKKPGAKAI